MGGLRNSILVAAILWGGGAACGEEPLPGPDEGGSGEFGADHIGLAVSTDIREEGALRARVFGDTVHTWENAGRMLFFPVRVDLYDVNGALTGHLTADRGELDTNTQRMACRGKCRLINPDSTRKVLTDELYFDPRSGRIWSDVEATIIEGSSTLHGTGFTATSDLSDIEMSGSTGESVTGGQL